MESPQAWFTCTAFQIGDVDLMDAGLFGKIDLPLTFGAAYFPDTFSRRRADVLCHSPILGLADALYLAHTLFRNWKGDSRFFWQSDADKNEVKI